jgi:disease resistance protein RPM1
MLFLQESQIVGMDDDIKVITEWILKEDNPPVIAVVGMGGQGKTLLLQRVFNSEEIRQHFDHQVWLAISQKFVVMELLRQVLRELEPNFDSKGEPKQGGAYKEDS